ncbi:hypothetical protein PV325_000784 [Microctonus aethiopoides]|uniref:Kinetochore-associated protein 1 n=1 Tax=Microctonus aethiopoides TaxID=144406 RepID=A0AA39F6P5_9HYME|nr:hypothetical protein PV325_000784 [Microctonus aethiopoides]KAK0163968.1 hypothetical protein PV328_002647 [Microctonus aethiopoides]
MTTKWNRVTSGFDCEDETINFGTRNFAENNGSIYETWTLATIESDSDNENENITQNPNVKATIWYEKMCIAIDTCITIFHDQTCRDVLTSIGFDSPITSYCLSMDGLCLFVSVEDITLHCFILNDGGRQIFNIDMSEYNCSNIVKIYLQEKENIIDIIVISSNGDIYRVNGIDRDLINNETIDYHQITKSINHISSAQSVEYCTQINLDGHANESRNNDQLSMIIIGEELCLLPDKISCCLKNLPFQYTKVQFFNNYKAMICLRTDGYLSIVCMKTLLGIKIWDGPVKDFITIREGAHDLNQMLVLMAPKNNESTSLLHLISFPDFKIIFTMSVSSLTYLVDIMGDTIDRLLYLEGIKKSDDSLDVIRIKAIEEGMPEFRLERLLRQRRFDEALTFAKKFNLDTESIYRAEASFSMNGLRLQINNKEIVNWNEFKIVLDKINDITFIQECCKNTLTYNYKDTRNLLEYLRQRIIKYINEHEEIHNKDVRNLLQDVNNNLKKLETFEIIQKIKMNKQNNENVDSTEWNKFCKANLLEECIKYLSFGELDAAALIWIRHTPSFYQNINEDIVIGILNAIPANLLPSDLWTWLHHFIPSVTSFIPGALAKIINWGCRKTKTFETFHRHDWPDIGIKFANGLIDLLHFDDYNVCFQFHQQYANKNSEFHQLTKLIQAMTDLLELKSQYKVLVPLSTYLGDATDVINLLLNKVHIDEINGLMKNFLQKYMLNNSLQNDKVLSSFIQNTLRNSKDWWLGEKAPWDKRLTIVIGYIHNIQNRLQQTLFVLKKAPVPWSDVLIQLAQQSFVYDHPLVSQIRFESNYVTEKLILKKYGFAHTGQSMVFFHSIVKQNRSSMIDDIFQSTKTDRNLRMTILHFCVSYHLKQGNIDNMINIFRQLTDDIVVECCQQLVYVIQSKFNFSVRQDKSVNCYMTFEVLGSVDTLLRDILARNSKYCNKLDLVLETISNLRNLHRLNMELKICITMNSYIKNKEEILLDYVKKLIDVNISDKFDWSSICKKIERANSLLCLPKFFGLYCLLDMFKHSADLKSYVALHLNDKQIILDEEVQYVNKICTLLVQNPVNDSKISMCLRNLYSSILLNSDEKNLLFDNLYLGRHIDTYNNVVGTLINEEDSSLHSTAKNSIRNFYPIYRDASVLSGCDLLPLLKEAFEICSFYRTKIRDDNSTVIHDNETNIELLSKSLLNRVKSAQNEHCDFSLLNIIATVYFELHSYLPASEKSVAEIRLVFNHCVDTMFKKVINSGIFDMQLGLTCLFLLPEAEALKLLSSIARIFQIDYSRDQFVKDLGFEYSRLTNDISHMEKFKVHRILHYWGKRLSNYGISHREILQSDTVKKREILRIIMASNKPDTLELLKNFCKNFGFNVDDCYLSYLECLLTSWQPNYTVNDQNELKVDKEDVEKLMTTCKKVASEIVNKEALKRNLGEIIMQINFYHYEIFLILLELSEESNVEAKSHLCFLQNYTRIGAPTDIEYEEWKKFSQENISLPSIAKWRLPFLPKVDQNKLIISELNLKTYEEWLKISGVLKIPVCNICTLAVKGAVTEAWKIDSDNYGKNATKWSINLRNSTLLKDIKSCIDCMIKLNGKDGLYYGTAALYYVVNHTPPGADLVAAAKECFVYSERWQQECNQTIQTVNTKLPKIKEKYLKYMFKHVLHTHGLGQEKYLNLVDNPEKLLRELYNDETIPYRYKCAISNRPDINSAVDTLGNIYPLNLIKIRLELLNDWLQPWDDSDNGVNDSISTNFAQHLTTSASNDSFIMDNNLLRACYVAGSADESFINYLIAIAFPEDYDNCSNPCVRFRALRVLQSITNDESLQDYVKRDIHTINKYMKTLKYLSELERLGLGGYSVKGFDDCSKQKLVQVLINSQYYTSRALSLIPQLYIDYKISNYNLLTVALNRMVELSLVKELKRTLSILGSAECIIDSNGYVAAWQIIINDPFNKLDQSCTETIENCIETLRLLHACPIIDKLEFSSIINCCVRAKQLHLAAALLPVVVQNKDKDFIITELARSEKLNDITAKLTELKIKGILIVRQALMILEQTGVVSSTTNN